LTWQLLEYIDANGITEIGIPNGVSRFDHQTGQPKFSVRQWRLDRTNKMVYAFRSTRERLPCMHLCGPVGGTAGRPLFLLFDKLETPMLCTKAIELLFKTPGASNNAIALAAGCRHATVCTLRRKLEDAGLIPRVDLLEGIDGRKRLARMAKRNPALAALAAA
jgi:hypothetical protein